LRFSAYFKEYVTDGDNDDDDDDDDDLYRPKTYNCDHYMLTCNTVHLSVS